MVLFTSHSCRSDPMLCDFPRKALVRLKVPISFCQTPYTAEAQIQTGYLFRFPVLWEL